LLLSSPVPVKIPRIVDMRRAADIPVHGLVTGCEYGPVFQAVRRAGVEEDLEGGGTAPRG